MGHIENDPIAVTQIHHRFDLVHLAFFFGIYSSLKSISPLLQYATRCLLLSDLCIS